MTTYSTREDAIENEIRPRLDLIPLDAPEQRFINGESIKALADEMLVVRETPDGSKTYEYDTGKSFFDTLTSILSTPTAHR